MVVATIAALKCKKEVAPRVLCGALVAVKTSTGWEVVCPRCKEKVVLD